MEKRNRRAAAWWKRFHQRVENGNRSQREKFNGSNRDDGRHFHDRRIHLAVCEQRGCAFMAGFIRVMMDQLVQGLAGSQRGHEQNQPHQQGGNERLAELTKMFLVVLQAVCNIANDMPPTIVILIDVPGCRQRPADNTAYCSYRLQ